MEQAYWLTNVRLETGYKTDNGRVIGTITELHHLLIQDGKIEDIKKASEEIQDERKKIDTRELLALPSFQESHFHLDKSYIGGEWKAVNPVNNLIERLEDEAKILPIQLAKVKERAKLLIEKIADAGSTHIRTHVNIDPYVGLKHLEYVREALSEYDNRLTYEIVAFPQHGLLRSDAEKLMRKAMKEGATIVGGLDPGGVDGYIERSLAMMMDIAVEANADIDMHLHDGDYLGIYTMNKLFEMIEESGWINRASISHGFALGGIPEEEAEEVADRFIELGVGLKSTAPMRANTTIPPFLLLKRKGVSVALGCDSMFDSWGSFGTADILERVGRLGEYYRWTDERSLAESLGYITNNRTPLNASGTKVWPKIGDKANIVLVNATCSAETVARKSKIAYVLHKGKMFEVNEKISTETSVFR
ncbi:amidohydrolase [Niallia sp. NCCP-28]|uniref:amidohydrolase n=1 Tax=Niallia sp. NCCP-28 TaxID=2934712 RepID=UPI0020844EBF|nr:amidohydrolase [Niallia sp. NCCP-28]GKU85080.1 deaminase [Niallia sp. NCCP-28]